MHMLAVLVTHLAAETGAHTPSYPSSVSMRSGTPEEETPLLAACGTKCAKHTERTSLSQQQHSSFLGSKGRCGHSHAAIGEACRDASVWIGACVCL